MSEREQTIERLYREMGYSEYMPQEFVDDMKRELGKAYDAGCAAQAQKAASESDDDLTMEEVLGLAQGLKDAEEGRTKSLEQVEHELDAVSTPEKTPFSKGYKHRDGSAVSDACGDGKHAECTEDFTKCHCTYRGCHTVPHAYMNPRGSAVCTAPDDVPDDNDALKSDVWRDCED